MTHLVLDTEFTDLSKQGELISIALVENESSYFYAELTDCWEARMSVLEKARPAQVQWIQEHVVGHLRFTEREAPFVDQEGQKVGVKGDRAFVREALASFLSRYAQVELVCDVGHFDMLHFIDLFGDAIHDMPAQVSRAYRDYNQMFAESRGISLRKAFSTPRHNAHNALDDALNTYRQWRLLTDE